MKNNRVWWERQPHLHFVLVSWWSNIVGAVLPVVRPGTNMPAGWSDHSVMPGWSPVTTSDWISPLRSLQIDVTGTSSDLFLNNDLFFMYLLILLYLQSDKK